MQSDSENKGKLLTFFELLKEYPIEVPIIQRDYAQGRKDQLKVRQSFLKALYDSLYNNETLMLDFIYGSIDDDKFQPLDGQQRLTTLFLLHCYASIVSKVDNENSNILTNFSYETRMTSRDFCKKLVNNLSSFSDHDLYKSLDSDALKISSSIMNSSWFFLSWQNDPTIKAMLNTLDDIHEIFVSIDNLWDKLTKKKIIQFYYIELEHLGLTDDLYIKMNARGKLLTTFENFKASIEKKVNDLNWEKNIPIQSSFEVKIDTKWTDFFWNKFRTGNSIDDAFVKFFAFVFMVDVSLDKSLNLDSKSEKVRKLHENSDNISIDLLSEATFNRMIGYLDLLNGDYQTIIKNPLRFDLFRHSTQTNFLHEILTSSGEASYTQKVLLYAQVIYFSNLKESSDFDNESYNIWMRVIRNLVSLGDLDRNGKRVDIIRSPQAFVGVLNLISDLSTGSNNIYQFLANQQNKINSVFSRSQVEEERVKAFLILDDPKREKLIHQLEDTDTLRGRLDFIFYCIDFNSNFNPSELNSFDDNQFKIVSEAFIENLSNEKCLTNDLRRALLTIEVDSQFNFYDYWQSYWYYIEDMNKRKLIAKYREIEYILYSDYKSYFKILIHKLIDKNLEEIVECFSPPEFFPQWKTRLIKEKILLDNTKSKFVAISEDNSFCYLLKSARPRDSEGSTKVV